LFIKDNLLNARAEIDWQGELLRPMNEKAVYVSGVNDPMVANFKEVQERLQNPPWQWMLES